jgi:hypothetical protein
VAGRSVSPLGSMRGSSVHVDHIARAWVAYWQEEERTGRFPNSAVGNFASRLHPDTGWAVILRILDRLNADPKDPLFKIFAASPVEDFIADHGAIVIDRVEAEAATNPRFKLLLGGVWRRGMPLDIWERVERCRERSWNAA